MARALLIGLRILATPVLALLLVASVASCTAISVIRGSLLDPDFYLDALDENRVYDRVYTELLQDPGMQAKMTDLLGGTQDVPPDEAVVLLRRVLPPENLQEQTERNVRVFLAYLKRDSDELPLGIALGPMIENIRPVAVEYTAERLMRAEREPMASQAAYDTRLAEVVEGLKRGAIPESVPVLALSEREQASAVSAILDDAAASEDERKAVAQALAGTGTTDALIAALDPLLRQRIDERRAILREALGPGEVLDLVGRAASDQDTTKEAFLSDLEPARDVASAVDTWGIPIAAGPVALVTVLLGVLYLPSRARALAVAGTALLFVGLLSVAGWWVQSEIMPGLAHRDILDAALGAPEPERDMAADVARSLVRDSAMSAWPSLVAVALAGGGLVGIAFACRTRPGREAEGFERCEAEDVIA